VLGLGFPNFVDEKKLLQPKSNLCTKILGRLSIIVFNLLLFIIFMVSYTKDKNYLDRNATLVALTLFAVAQLASFLVVHPILILFHAFFFANFAPCCGCCCGQLRRNNEEPEYSSEAEAKKAAIEVLRRARDGLSYEERYNLEHPEELGEHAKQKRPRRSRCLQRAVPLSFQLYTDYVELSE